VAPHQVRHDLFAIQEFAAFRLFEPAGDQLSRFLDGGLPCVRSPAA
jgi:hypothetical protein